MDKEQGVYSFWNRLGLPVYEENSVPDDAALPYVTYEKVSGSFEDVLNTTGNIWTRNSSWQEADALKNALEAEFEHGGVIIDLNKGKLYIAKGSPFAQSMAEESDRMIKRYVINLNIEFLTAY